MKKSFHLIGDLYECNNKNFLKQDRMLELKLVNIIKRAGFTVMKTAF